MATPSDSLTNDQLTNCRLVLDRLNQLGFEHFGMSHWAETKKYDADLVLYSQQEYPLHELAAKPDDDTFWCGTAACLAGTAAIVLRPRIPTPGSIIDRDLAAREIIATMLGIHVGLPPRQAATNWFFVGEWPAWAQNRHDFWYQRAATVIDSGPDQVNRRYRFAEWHTITEVLDDLVHGNRQHWWDGDRLEVEPDEEEYEQEGAEEWLFDPH